LLRSAVVSPEHRGTGNGRRLVELLLERAEEDGIEQLYLLTTTAEDYFPRFGFALTTRSTVPEAVKASAEFQGACPDTAIVMTLRIGTSAKARE
jgi:amino-acid N-acetyltransferase